LEKEDNTIPKDEDIILATTLSSEADEFRKKTSVSDNSFVKTLINNKDKKNKSL